MENAPFCQSMTYMTTAEYRELIEERKLLELQGEGLKKKNFDLINEVDRLRAENDRLREQLEQTRKDLEESEAENKELAQGSARLYGMCQRIAAEYGIPPVMALDPAHGQDSGAAAPAERDEDDDPLPF